jgi:hypothetical protein
MPLSFADDRMATFPQCLPGIGNSRISCWTRWANVEHECALRIVVPRREDIYTQPHAQRKELPARKFGSLWRIRLKDVLAQ